MPVIWAFGLLNVLVVLLVSHLRYAGDGLAYASPVAMSPATWWAVTAAVAAGMAATAWGGRKRLADVEAREALAGLWFVPTALLYEWAMLGMRFRWVDWMVFGLGFVAFVLLPLRRDHRRGIEQGLTMRHFAGAVRMLAAPTLAMAGSILLLAALVGTDFEPKRLLGSVAYPLYALLELTALQAFMVTRLARLARSRAAVVCVSAGVFSMLHWPNGALMLACGVGAAVWTWVYLRRPNVYAVSLSMGITAIVLLNALPRERTSWRTHNLRTGPIFVERYIEGRPPGDRPAR